MAVTYPLPHQMQPDFVHIVLFKWVIVSTLWFIMK